MTGDPLAAALACHRAGQWQPAQVLYHRCLAADPAAAGAWHGLGVLALQQGRLAAAATLIERALSLQAGVADWYSNRGNIAQAAGDGVVATVWYRQALRLDPGHGTAWSNLGAALQDRGEGAAALAALTRAVRLMPDSVEALANLGNSLAGLGRAPAAARAQTAALVWQPDSVMAWNNLGNALTLCGRAAEAAAAYRRALALEPAAAAVQSNLIFALNFLPDLTQADHQAERRRWAAAHAGPAVTRWPAIVADPGRRLRIGYISAHFRAQAAAFAFAPVILHADPAQFASMLYSDTPLADGVTDRLRAAAAGWCDIRALSDGQVAARVARDRIDLLVDLSGHMAGHRLGVFARKPAPLQATGWGEPTGTGLAAIDLLLADPVLVPVAERPLLAERVADLPCYLGYLPPDDAPEPGPLPAGAGRPVTFGSFNRRAKLSAPLLAAWAGLLQRVPDARLLLKDAAFDDPEQRAAVAAALGQPESGGRLRFLGRVGRLEHFAAWAQVDIALDSFPHGGGMTTLDALWMGVPVVSRTGATNPSRGSAAILAAVGAGWPVAADWPGYLDIAAALAADRAGLAGIRAALRPRLRATVADGPAYAAAVGAVYRRAWRRWCAVQPGR